MSTIDPSNKIYASVSSIPNAGKGVFAKANIVANEVIEVCPIIEVPLTDSSNHDEKGLLTNYFFYFGEGLALALGFGSLYNHSYEPNATYIKQLDSKTIEFRAIRKIKIGEEITVNYNLGNPNDQSTPPNSGVPAAD